MGLKNNYNTYRFYGTLRVLSFVVQNFYNTLGVVRTKKYNSMIMLSSSRLLFLFLKNNTHILFYKQNFIRTATTLLRIYNKNFIKPSWVTYTRLDDLRYGLYTNNLSKSLTHHTTESLTLFPQKVNLSTNNPIHPGSRWLCHYVNHVPTLSFPISKDLYNNVVMYFLFFLVRTYSPARPHFKLAYNFIILPNTFSLYLFCNSFYFRIWNY